MIFNFFMYSIKKSIKDEIKVKYEMKENYEIKSSFKDRFEL